VTVIIKVMADYESFPLWRRDNESTTNIDPMTMRLSPDLARQLLGWADEYDRTLDRDDPHSSHPAMRGKAEAHKTPVEPDKEPPRPR
jgi:hypothetical protein